MKTLIKSTIAVFPALLLALLISVPFVGKSQTKVQVNNVATVIKGTSSLHDWDMKSAQGKLNGIFNFSGEKLTGFSGLVFTIGCETLKSGHSGMDKNAYKALDTKANPNITFTQTGAGTLTQVDAHTYQLKAIGTLNIAGTAKQTEVIATCKYNPADKSFTISGNKKFKMTDYKVTPPTALLGTIKTGDDITIEYSFKLDF